MLKEKNNQLSIYSILYNKIPENNILKVLRDEVDFSFINKKLEKTYCKRYGRPAKEPELSGTRGQVETTEKVILKI